MFNRLYQAAVATLIIAVAPMVNAGAPVDKETFERISAAMNSPAMGLSVSTVSTSDIQGMYEVQFDNGPMVYATADGKHFLVGDLFQVDNGQFVNLTEQRRDGERLAKMEALDEADMIVFAPEGEVKGEITVFTDTTCFYCQKLHNEVPELNKHGVQVRYLAFPRGGTDSAGYRQLVGAWCAENPQQTLTALKNKEPVPVKQCDSNPVDEQYQLGQQLGVRGTPAIITDTGQMIPGYQDADKILATLGVE
ncbi:protein-disulfide isomerase [Halioglobus japonicus]|uniref:Thiol:disulfide interchange protein n=1 Tax=Halioglobus japonicus TaxID=930805 RepID=A0AAP8MGX1_9GAMM|nr:MULTISPECIES: DsbC family protein [Halioglobus]AQA19347.1 protein-disulfide isomerase [Halioglobus japonicus]KZX59171.1 protein-disulfide isomerase [Halioglobus sp. HI00S01]PLW87606.1 DsbC family protein [Halioglobus japonicus]GHD07579.1 thiol:disulfide interchange protein DsbC [Halioglobus japonicus]